jgi:hypothetical protein
MKIIITESQFYNLIPNELKRRLIDDDFKIIDDILWSDIETYHAPTLDGFINFVITDTITRFVNDYKLDTIDYNSDNWGDDSDDVFNLWWKLNPFLKMKYHNKLADYYSKHPY